MCVRTRLIASRFGWLRRSVSRIAIPSAGMSPQSLPRPEITFEHATAEFEFTGVVLFRMCWESAEPELGDSTLEFRGDTFRWYLQSPLLQVQRDRSSENDAARLRHYQLICGELIDVICYSAPKILFHAYEPATRMA